MNYLYQLLRRCNVICFINIHLEEDRIKNIETVPYREALQLKDNILEMIVPNILLLTTLICTYSAKKKYLLTQRA